MKTPFSAVILDLTVPGNLGEKETIRRLREINPHVMAFVARGFSNDPIMANYRIYGLHSVITKPYALIELSTILHQQFGVASSKSTPASLRNLEPSQGTDFDVREFSRFTLSSFSTASTNTPNAHSHLK